MTKEAPKTSTSARLAALEKGPLAARASVLRQMLEEDNDKILNFINEGDDLKDVPMGDPPPLVESADSANHSHAVLEQVNAPSGYCQMPDD